MDILALAMAAKVKGKVATIEEAVEDLEAGSLSALNAGEGQVPVADGQGDWEWADAPVKDVQVAGTSVVSNGVANVPQAGSSTMGVASFDTDDGIGVDVSTGAGYISKASDAEVKTGTKTVKPIVPSNQHLAVFYGLAKAAGHDEKDESTSTPPYYSPAAISAIKEMLYGGIGFSGSSTVTINALPGIHYHCDDELSTLAITLPAGGVVDVVFKSGSTPTVLTVTPPTGVTIKWPAWFDPTSLDANTTYEINIMNGLAVVMLWT